MKIAQVVAYVSKYGEFGGPISVAVQQTKELLRRGHDVDFIAGWDGEAEAPDLECKVHLFPTRRLLRRKLSTLISVSLLAYIRNHWNEYDVWHVHLGRDLITLPAARILAAFNAPTVAQTHGMLTSSDSIATKFLDLTMTRRVLAHARRVLVLTDKEVSQIERIGQAQVEKIPNGIERPRIAKSFPDYPEVLFLARLHPRKRALAFAEAASILSKDHSIRFSIVGPDEGDLAALTKYIASNKLERTVFYEGAITPKEAATRLSRASVFVLPSRGEVFPMTVLESLAVGTPVILTSDCGISPLLKQHEAALITSGDPIDIANQIRRVLYTTSLSSTLVSNGARLVENVFSISAIGKKLEAIYESRAKQRFPR